MSDNFDVVRPVDESVYVSRGFASEAEIANAVSKAKAAQLVWAAVPLAERMRLCQRAVDMLVSRADQLGEKVTWQVGRPLHLAAAEISSCYQ